MSYPLYMMDKKKDAYEFLAFAKTILSEFEKGTGHSHFLLKDVENRILSFFPDNKNEF